jgi:penicillin-binding protein 1C
MAIDEGLCAPETVVEDAPATFAGYRPRNFDRDYAGPVPVRAALVQSLNIPALRFAQRLGLEPVVRRLRALGLSTLDQPAERYGLSIAVGTCEVTLLDLANAYACLARLGVYRDAAWLEREPVAPGARLFSPEAAWLVADMLSGDEWSLDGWGHVADAALPRVAWKTGTSSGQRDAWCLAWNPEYVVGVWIGNPDGRASPALVGAGAAAPVAHQVFRRLYPAGRAPWFVRPAGLATRPVCAVSGLPPGPGCAVTLAADYIPGITAPAPCAGHGLAGIGTDAAGRAPRTRIVAPAAGETFRLDADARHLAQSIALRAQAADAAGDLHWFVDRRFLARAEPGATVLWPLQPGPHLIACSDAQGRGDSVRIVVE